MTAPGKARDYDDDDDDDDDDDNDMSNKRMGHSPINLTSVLSSGCIYCSFMFLAPSILSSGYIGRSPIYLATV